MEEKRKNVLVTGACGQLGRALRLLCGDSPNHFVFTDIAALPGEDILLLDITNPDAVRLVCESERIDVIVNCAAYNAVDAAEDDLSGAESLNHTAVAGLAAVASGCGATLIHISSDYVFPGDRPVPIRETDEPAPLNVYGATKLAGEKAVLDSGCKALIVRTAWLYSPWGKNFVKTMLRLFRAGAGVEVVNDQVGSPTSALSLARFLLRVIDTDGLERTGLYHYVDAGAVSWFDLAHAVLEYSGLQARLRPCSTEEYRSRARRPAYSVLDTSLARATFGVEPPYWRDALRDCLQMMEGHAR